MSCKNHKRRSAQGGIKGIPFISEFQKFRLPTDPNQFTDSPRPVPQRGVRTSRNAGRDAVDAAAPLTNGAGAYGEVVSF